MKQRLGFEAQELPPEVILDIQNTAHRARADILTMTTLAKSGHPGGSMSSIDIYATLYACAKVFPGDPDREDRDRIIVSHGHTSPGVYATLARCGFFDIDDAICGFRQAWSPFEGHIERQVPGVEWSTGNLGQGLSAGCGMALASRLTRKPFHVFVCMGDGEQQKGQVSEARRFAVKYGLSNLTAIVDYNGLQISGSIRDVMYQDIRACWEADGWRVLEIDGHDVPAIYGALREAVHAGDQVCILARTVMGKGVPDMENQARYHGAPLDEEAHARAMTALGQQNRLEHYRELRTEARTRVPDFKAVSPQPRVDPGPPREYTRDNRTDNRSAFGHALADIGRNNPDVPVAVFDCDLAVSVKTGAFASVRPDAFFQAGIQEHHAAVAAGALATQGVLTFWADFGVFAAAETYNQQRLNDINQSNLKVVATHCGLDVGEDGKTHQAIDYIGLMRNLHGCRVIVPADPNETDRVIRHIATEPGMFFVALGRSKLDVITTEDGRPLFGGDYRFEYGKLVEVRQGLDIAIISTGTVTHHAVAAWDLLRESGYSALLYHAPTPLLVDDDSLIHAAVRGVILTCEDHNVNGGLGTTVTERLQQLGLPPTVIKLGVRGYQPSGPSGSLFARAEFDAASIAETAKLVIERPR